MAAETDAPGGAKLQDGRAGRAYVRFTAKVARVICARVAAGEHLSHICADPDMPSRPSVTRWARKHTPFREAYHRAKALGAPPQGLGRRTTYCEVVAHEICMRIAEGESLTSISNDPAMPAMWTIMHWQSRSADFADALLLAKQARAERLADTGWDLAMAATPDTAFLTHVRLGHLRWKVGIMSPKTHGRTKPAEAPEPQKVTEFLFKHFRLEEHPQTGLVRMVTYLPDPDTGQPRRAAEGAWARKPGGLIRAPDMARLEGAEGAEAEGADAEGVEPGAAGAGETLAQARARAAARHPPRDPEGWL